MGSMAKDMSDDAVDSPLKVKLTDLANKISKFGYIGAAVIGVALLDSKGTVSWWYRSIYGFRMYINFKRSIRNSNVSSCNYRYGSTRRITTYDCYSTYEKYI